MLIFWCQTLISIKETECLWRVVVSKSYGNRENSQNGPGMSFCQSIKTHSKMPGVVLKVLWNLKRVLTGQVWQFRHQKENKREINPLWAEMYSPSFLLVVLCLNIWEFRYSGLLFCFLKFPCLFFCLNFIINISKKKHL